MANNQSFVSLLPNGTRWDCSKAKFLFSLILISEKKLFTGTELQGYQKQSALSTSFLSVLFNSCQLPFFNITILYTAFVVAVRILSWAVVSKFVPISYAIKPRYTFFSFFFTYGLMGEDNKMTPPPQGLLLPFRQLLRLQGSTPEFQSHNSLIHDVTGLYPISVTVSTVKYRVCENFQNATGLINIYQM